MIASINPTKISTAQHLVLRWAEKDQFPKTYFKKLKEERPTTCYKNSDLLEFLNKY